MRISQPEPHLAKMLVLDLVNSDPRLTINEDMVEFTPLNHGERNLFETDYVVFDLETTGAKCPPCRITEIGAFRVNNGKIVDKFHFLIEYCCKFEDSPARLFRSH